MEGARKLSRRDVALFWFGVLAAPSVWALHLTVAYGYDEAACSDRVGVSAVEPLILASGAVCAAIAVAGGVAAWSVWRRASRGAVADPRAWVRVLGVGSVLSSVLFLFAIVLQTVQALVLSACLAG